MYVFKSIPGKACRTECDLTRCSERMISYKFGNYPAVRGDTLGDDYTMAGIVFAAIVLHHHGNREMVEKEIKKLHREQEALKNGNRSITTRLASHPWL